MTIKCVNLDQVSCDDCNEIILIKKWPDARKLGWAVPNDGAFQRCPACTKKYLDNLMLEIKIKKIADECPLVNKEKAQGEGNA